MRTENDGAVRAFHRLACRVRWGAFIRWLINLLVLAELGLARVAADGCFVFKWNKNIDINEPTQKAIICFDSGHEDLLLQVKYEGPLEEFGWLIPTPSLPKVEKGRMEPFYELSQFTQRHFGTPEGRGSRVTTLGPASAGEKEERVKVLEIKTVGAYQVSVLSAQDAGSLKGWLEAHDYSFPEGKSEIVEEYTRKGWYFLAAKIELNKGLGFQTVTATSPRDPQGADKARRHLQSKLSSGELHPLLISFDTPKAVFPLRISAMNGKSSEISLYILATEPLLNPFIFRKSSKKLGQQYARWEEEKPKRAMQLREMTENSRTMSLRFYLDSFYSANPRAPIPESLRDYTREDLVALAREGDKWSMPTQRFGEIFYGQPGDLLQCMSVAARALPDCGKTFLALKAGEWFLTKQVHTFTASEMQDLEFEPAFPALARILSQPGGSVAAQMLAELESKTHADLVRACQNTNAIERLNAVIGIELSRKPGFGDTLSRLLKDGEPAVRLHALRAAAADPENRFVDTAVGLLRDPEQEIRWEASGYLSDHERPDRTAFYLDLLNDPDPTVRMHSLGIASWINRYDRGASSDVLFREALRLLKDQNEQVRAAALHALYRMQGKGIPRADILPFLNSPVAEVNAIALTLLRPGPSAPDGTATLSSAEAAALTRNPLTMARLAGLKILQQNADAEAVELMLPLLTDTNAIVRNRAFFVLRTVTGENVSEKDPAKWQAWWKAKKPSFRSGKPLQ